MVHMVRDRNEMEQPKRSGSQDGRSVASTMRLVVVGIVVALFVVFCAVNTDGVKVSYVFGTAKDVPLIVVMAVSAVFGALIGALLRLRRRS